MVLWKKKVTLIKTESSMPINLSPQIQWIINNTRDTSPSALCPGCSLQLFLLFHSMGSLNKQKTDLTSNYTPVFTHSPKHKCSSNPTGDHNVLKPLLEAQGRQSKEIKSKEIRKFIHWIMVVFL